MLDIAWVSDGAGRQKLGPVCLSRVIGIQRMGYETRLYWGLVRERGMVRTSTTQPIRAATRSSMNSAIERVEWPMV